MTLLLKSAGEGFADIGHMFKLANSEPQAKTLTETLDLFLVGVTRDKPISVQGFLAGTDMKYLLGLPVADAKKLKDFLKNIDDLDLTNKPVVGVPNLFEIKGLIEAGAFLRYEPGAGVWPGRRMAGRGLRVQGAARCEPAGIE